MTPDALEAVIAATDLTPEQRRAVETAEANGHREVREPLVYQADGDSYFADLARRHAGDSVAGERLERHWRQMAAVPLETRQVRGTVFEYRANPNVTAGTGGEFAPPLWLNELFATAPRPGEVIQRLVREKEHQFTMPSGASSVNLTRITKGTVVNDDTPNAPVDNQDVETAPVKAEALMYAGESDWSIQTLDQSPAGARLDQVVFTDLGESLDAELETDLIQGRGEEFKEALGLLNIKGIEEINNSGAVEAKVIFPELGKAMAAVGIKRRRPPDAWLLGTPRMAFLSMAADGTEQRPLILTDNVGDEWPVASMAGVAVYLDDAIPRTVNANQEPVFSVRSDDFMLWHSPVRTMVLDKPLSGTLGVRFALYRKTASMLHRYPSGIAVVTGTGMKPATGF